MRRPVPLVGGGRKNAPRRTALPRKNCNFAGCAPPPLSEQRRIVEILDRFDTLTNSISEGLPREIALRRKQYEYYRDALLRFPSPTPTA